MKFTQLRLSGFKSFVEPTELLIKDGLTGIVGPNGCGKSNLVEALRWVMGETSAKNMRGGAMDDVIFAGTSSRPPRNMAEVTLGLDNSDRIAPAAYNDSREVDITRRIRRDSGSDYRINGRVSRARDVQLLFADMATGANSTAIVSQGRVGSLINAKPKDRRHLLEEAAGISGLHSRRHEAELRLKAAETNLERVDDVAGQLEVQLGSLKRQARQANRYRNISGHIRKAEALLLLRKQEQALRAQEKATKELADASAAVAELTKQVAIAQNAALKANEILAPLREREASAAAKVQRLTLERENLDAEEERLKRTRQQLEDQRVQISHDMSREKSLEKDAADAVTRLTEEQKSIHEKAAKDAPKLKTVQSEISDRQDQVRKLQSDFDLETEQLAAHKAKEHSLLDQQKNTEASMSKLTQRLTEIESETNRIDAALTSLTNNQDVQAKLELHLKEILNYSSDIEAFDEKCKTADQQERQARDRVREAEKETSAVQAEIKALLSLLEDGSEGKWTPIAENLSVKKGYEAALGAALGEDLEAPLDQSAQSYWSADACTEHPLPLFEDDLVTLDQFVSGEEILVSRLKMIGITAAEAGDRLSKTLKPGQRLISKEGDLWRWDGFVRKAGAKTAAALRLEQRNRLAGLEKEKSSKEAAAEKSRVELEQFEKKLSALRLQEKELRTLLRTKEQEANSLRALVSEQTRKLATLQSRQSSLAESKTTLLQEKADLEQLLSHIKQQRSSLPDITDAQQKLETARQVLREERESLGNMRSTFDQFTRESALRRDRLDAIAVEKESWIQRSNSVASHFSQLEMRFSSTEQELKDLEGKPEEILLKRGQLMDEIARAEGARSTAKDQLSEGEAVVSECNEALRKSQESLALCREERVRFQADKDHSIDNLQQLAHQIYEKLECSPEDIRKAGEIEEDEEIPPVDVSERRVERLKKERDGMGPVNLRAEIEADEIDEQLSTLLKERKDLEDAILRLRQGIASLNKEGRERLLIAFEKVDAHFQTLFKQVFGGGHAHLTLTESDDPLAAGLEIMASPPGKRLQLMSLLSGGEQALTAVALLFAVFLTNPAPICVLDEVDAPLDDVNVERLCNLLDSISENSSTRFLVVTHHPITMARMDRLFGVTMAERGISQLVSVDLTRAQLMTNETV
ncbi:chromosome segregation protein SMC [Sneathiella aquimaris]|uniref:chromosome segregation protein SMC n=1 Tax=Sneathiella aquimaris TaxID=2599305 RepID=UPI00146ADC0C|nr:chromosome segregation protein SMC [Sneathiella aquimaris]